MEERQRTSRQRLSLDAVTEILFDDSSEDLSSTSGSEYEPSDNNYSEAEGEEEPQGETTNLSNDSLVLHTQQSEDHEE